MADIEIIKGADNGNPPDTLRQMYPKVNRNFQRINTELTGHINSILAHKAEYIAYTGQVPGGDVKEAIDNVNGRISEIVAQSGDDITELVDARGVYSVLRDRLDASDMQMNERIKKGDLVVNVLDFGAVGDGTTDDTVAFQNAIDHCIDTGRALLIPANTKSYLIGDLIIDQAITIRGEGKGRPVILAKENTLNLFTLRSRDIIIETLHIDMSQSTNPLSSAFYFDTVNCPVFYEVQLNNTEVWNAYCAIKDGNSTGVIVNTYIDHFTCYKGRGTQIKINDSQGFTYFTKTSVDFTTNTNTVNFPGWVISNASGLILNDCDTLGHGTGVSELANGFEFNNCTAVWFNRVMCDYLGNVGIKINNSHYMYLNDIVTSICLGGGIEINNSTNIKGGVINTGGTKGQSYGIDNKNGIILNAVNGFNVSNIHTYNNTKDGLEFTNCSRVNVGVMQSVDNKGYGFRENHTAIGTSVANIFGTCITAGNTAGNAVLVSPYTFITSIILDSGLAEFQSAGPVTL
ncbi:glycosyl hydrolase family 28-related protein [Paenibacillus glucanolyticus]|uniref:glycosyl hydrolase family 28-related protein n=1 Tax=Paenibacillus glucanolyticus TaxID=59843 RepID=UPI00096DF2E2|nr:glycosyl hydrolase family 28-related protein [Paenibacillus glucanolyticus]OMF70516.1 hypothetical protein BK142_23875 [Paenibacillus glucanolyticus]